MAILIGGCEWVKDKVTYYDDAYPVTVAAKNIIPQECWMEESCIPVGDIDVCSDEQRCDGPWYTLAIVDVDKLEMVREVTQAQYTAVSKGSKMWVQIRKWGKDGKWSIHSIHINNPIQSKSTL
jgi:hypothetical protein